MLFAHMLTAQYKVSQMQEQLLRQPNISGKECDLFQR